MQERKIKNDQQNYNVSMFIQIIQMITTYLFIIDKNMSQKSKANNEPPLLDPPILVELGRTPSNSSTNSSKDDEFNSVYESISKVYEQEKETEDIPRHSEHG